MSYTKQFIMDNPGKNFDGSDLPTEQEQREAYDYYEAAMSFPTIAEKKHLVFKSVKDQIVTGYLNPLTFYKQAKIILDLLEDLKKDPDIFDCVWNERQKWGKEKPVIEGSVIDISSRSTPDYNTCGDPVYDELKEKLKAREKFLKNLPPEGTVDPETGLLIKPPVIKESQFVTVKL
jgi:predicted DNA-binding protein YlxM (UPF0122 family)